MLGRGENLARLIGRRQGGHQQDPPAGLLGLLSAASQLHRGLGQGVELGLWPSRGLARLIDIKWRLLDIDSLIVWILID